MTTSNRDKRGKLGPEDSLWRRVSLAEKSRRPAWGLGRFHVRVFVVINHESSAFQANHPLVTSLLDFRIMPVLAKPIDEIVLGDSEYLAAADGQANHRC